MVSTILSANWIHKTLPRLKVSWSVNVVSLVIATSNIQLCKSLSEMFRDLHMLVATCAKHSKTEKKNVQKLAAIFTSHKPSTTPKWNTLSVFLIMVEATIVFSELICKYGSRVGAVPSTNVSRIRFPDQASYVGWVCCWFSTLHREVFLRALLFSPLLKNQPLIWFIWFNNLIWFTWFTVSPISRALVLS